MQRPLLLFFQLFWLGPLAARTKPHPLDAMQPGEHGHVVRVIDGDALVPARG